MLVPRSLLRAAVLVWTVVAALTSSAHADEAAVAREHFQRGTTLFDLQRYAEAAREYEAAFERRDDAGLLFNIGQAYRLAGDTGKALGAYRSFLRRKPHAPERKAVESRIAELQQLLEEQKRTQAAAPLGTLPPPGEKSADPAGTETTTGATAAPAPATVSADRSAEAPAASAPAASGSDRGARTKKLAGIITGAAGLAVAGVGGAFLGLAHAADDQLSHPAHDSTFDPALERRLHTDEAVGWTLLGVGGAAVVSGVVLYIAGRRESRRPLRVAFHGGSR